MSVDLYGVVYNPSSLVVIDNSGYHGGIFGFGDGTQVPTFEATHPTSGNLIYAIAMTPNATSADDYAWIYSNTGGGAVSGGTAHQITSLYYGVGPKDPSTGSIKNL